MEIVLATIQVEISCVVQTISCMKVFVPTSRIPIERRDKFKCFNVGLADHCAYHVIIIKLMTTEKNKPTKTTHTFQHQISNTKRTQ